MGSEWNLDFVGDYPEIFLRFTWSAAVDPLLVSSSTPSHGVIFFIPHTFVGIEN